MPLPPVPGAQKGAHMPRQAAAEGGGVEDGRAEVGAELGRGAFPTGGTASGAPPARHAAGIQHPGLQNQAPLRRHPGCPI